MSDLAERKKRTRGNYAYFLDYRTRWNDNDMYAHVNNSVYNFMADSIVNAYLIKSQVLQPERQSAQRGLVVRSRIDFFGPLSYPAIAELGLRVNNMGKSSVTYEVGIFEKDHADIRAVAEMTHVFVDGETLRPGRDGMTAGIRGALVAISTNSELRSKL